MRRRERATSILCAIDAVRAQLHASVPGRRARLCTSNLHVEEDDEAALAEKGVVVVAVHVGHAAFACAVVQRAAAARPRNS